MCIGKGMIIRRGQQWPDYDTKTNDHQPLVEKFKLRDDKLIDRDFVRIEVLALRDWSSAEPENWRARIDEKETLPAWFEKHKDNWLDKCVRLMCKTIVPLWLKEGIKGDIDFGSNATATTLGEITNIGGNADFRCSKITSTPKLTNIGGNADFWCSKIISTPKLENIGGYVDFRYSKITSVPKLENIGGDAYFEAAQKELAKKLEKAIKGAVFFD